MKQLMENWKRFLQEGIDSRIQKQIDALLAKPDAAIRIEGQMGSDRKRTNVRISYIRMNEDGTYMETGGDEEKEGYAWGNIRAMETNSSAGDCMGAMEINLSQATKGFGPLLYELTLEWASQNAGGLVSDRVSVSSDANQVWQKYSQRGDVDVDQMDLTNMNTKEFGLDQLTPDDESDDCEQESAYYDKEEWWRSPLSRAYKKKTFEVTQALERAGRLVREDK